MSIADIAASAQRYAKRAASALAVYGMLAAASPAEGQEFQVRTHTIDGKPDPSKPTPELLFTNSKGRTILKIHYNAPNEKYLYTFQGDSLGLPTTTTEELINLRDTVLRDGVIHFNQRANMADVPYLMISTEDLDVFYRAVKGHIAKRQAPQTISADTAAAPQAAKGPVLTAVYPTAPETPDTTADSAAARQAYQPPRQAPMTIDTAAAPAPLDTLVRQVPAGKFPQHSDEQLLESYERTSRDVNQQMGLPADQRQNGDLGQLLTQQRELHAALTQRGVSTRAYDDPQLTPDSELKNVRVVEYLQKHPDTLDKLVVHYPQDTREVAKQLILEGMGAGDELSLAFSEDGFGHKIRFGTYLEGKGPGQIDKLVTFDDVATRVMEHITGNPRDYAEGGKYHHRTVALSKILQILNAPIYQHRYGKPLIPGQVQPGEEVYIALKDTATTFGVSEGHVRFSQEILKTRMQSLILADFIERYLYTLEERDAALDRESRLASALSNVELTTTAISDFLDQANSRFKDYTISQIDSLAALGDPHAIELSRLLNFYQQQAVNADQQLAEMQTESERRAADVQKAAADKLKDAEQIGKMMGQQNTLDSTITALRGILQREQLVRANADAALSSMQTRYGSLEGEREALQRGYNDLLAENQQIAVLQGSLEAAIAERESAERLAAEERRRADNAEARAKFGGGGYVEGLVGDGAGWGAGGDFRLGRYHARIGGFGDRETGFHAEPSVPYVDITSPQLAGELITITDGKTARNSSLSLGVGYDVVDPQVHKYGLELVLDISRRKSVRSASVHEHVILRNEKDEVVAERYQPITQPDGGITQTRDFVISPALLTTIERLNKRLPASLKYLRFGPGAAIPVGSPEDTFLRFLLQAEF